MKHIKKIHLVRGYYDRFSNLALVIDEIHFSKREINQYYVYGDGKIDLRINQKYSDYSLFKKDSHFQIYYLCEHKDIDLFFENESLKSIIKKTISLKKQ